MELLEYRIKRKSRSDNCFYLCPIGDIHYGNSNCDEEALNKAINWINEIDAYVIGMGDYIDAININDKRFDVQQVSKKTRLDDLVTSQMKGLYKYLDRIDKNKIIGFLTGNHEDVIRTKYMRDITLELCNKYETNYLGYSAWIRLVIDRETANASHDSHSLKIFAHHGYGGARFRPTKQWKIEHLKDDKDYDILLMGHVHLLDAARNIRQTITKKGALDVLEKTTLEMITGSFLKTSAKGTENYAEKLGYGVTKTGIGTIKIELNRLNKNIEYTDLHVMM